MSYELYKRLNRRLYIVRIRVAYRNSVRLSVCLCLSHNGDSRLNGSMYRKMCNAR